MKTPILLINFKTYQESTGKNAIELSKIAKEISKNLKCNIISAVSAPDIYLSSKQITTFAQHIDVNEPGANTGKIPIQSIKENNAKGVLINHSEDRLSFKDIKIAINLCKENKLISVVCSKTVPESKAIAELNPDFIAIEPPELIGGDISVTTANPNIISNTVKIVKEYSKTTKVLCGAGVKTQNDVKMAIKLGADGVLVASGITKAKNKKQAIQSLAKGLLK